MVELYQQNNNYDNYNAMKHGYADKSKQITSSTIHLLEYIRMQLPTA